MHPRIRRLEADYQRTTDFFSHHPAIHLAEVEPSRVASGQERDLAPHGVGAAVELERLTAMKAATVAATAVRKKKEADEA